MNEVTRWFCRASAIRWIDDHFPGFVECQIEDLHGKKWTIIEKAPVVAKVEMSASTQFPQPVFIACEVIAWTPDEAGRMTAEIDTERPWHICSLDGTTTFHVRAETLSRTADWDGCD